jgi:hypothetical protein
MDVNVPKAFSLQMVQFYEPEDLFVLCESCLGKDLHEREDFAPILHVTTGQFADNVRVTHHLSIIQQLLEVRVSLPKMTYPH